jgi:hypothetical protein
MGAKRSNPQPRTYYTSFQASDASLTSAVVFGLFGEMVEKFSIRNFKLISLEENAWLRVVKGKYAPESWTGNYVRAGFLHIPNKGVYLVKDSPINDRFANATTANRLGHEFHISFAEAEELAKVSVRIPYNLKEIPVAQLSRNPVSKFAFGNAVKAYANFLRDAGVERFPIWILPRGIVDSQSQPFVRQVILRCMDNWSGLIGGADLHLPYGVRFTSSIYRGKTNDRDEVYSADQIIKALEAASLQGLEIPILRALRQSSALPVNYGEDPHGWGTEKN